MSREPSGAGAPGARLGGVAVPRPVVLACQLFVASYVLGLVLLLPGVGVPVASPSVSSFIVLLLFVAAWGAVTLWLIGAVLQRRNWGRWAMLGVLGLSWLIGAADILETFEGSFVEGAIDIACTAMEMAGCVLLFGTAATRWFTPESGAADAP